MCLCPNCTFFWRIHSRSDGAFEDLVKQVRIHHHTINPEMEKNIFGGQACVMSYALLV